MALGQVRHSLRSLGLTPVVQADTAGAAELVAQWGRKEEAAIASSLAAEIYGLQILRTNIEDAAHNTTRFYVMARQPVARDPSEQNLMTTFVFRVRNVPAALYKALGGFATNGVNMTKLESYMISGQFVATQFLCDADGHPEQAGAAAGVGGADVLLLRGAGAGGVSCGAVPAGAGRRGVTPRGRFRPPGTQVQISAVRPGTIATERTSTGTLSSHFPGSHVEKLRDGA